MGLFLCKQLSSVFSGENDEEESGDEDDVKTRLPDADPFLMKYSFVYRKVCKSYLKCDITPWSKAVGRKNGVVKLESLPTDFFDRDYRYPPGGGKRRFRLQFKIDGEIHQRVIGFRELMMKREYANYLEEVRRGNARVIRRSKAKGYPMYQYLRLGLGGGKNAFMRAPVTTDSATAAKKPTAGVGVKKTGEKKAGIAAGKKVTSSESKGETATGIKPVLKKAKNTKGGCFGSLFNKNHTRTKKELREKAKKNTELILKHQAVKKWKWPNKRKRLPVPESDPPGKYVVLLHRLYRMPKETEERDGEWMYLSSSTEENDPEVVSHFNKEMHHWMTAGISFESQKLFRQLTFLWTLMNISGRSFLHHRNNFYRGQIDFSYKWQHVIPFFLTTVLLWTILCMSVCSYTDINAQLNVHMIENPFLQVEKLELRKYWLPYSVMIGNLILAAFWSLSVILGDGPLIAHYLNCWCAALHEMETSGALDIWKITLRNLLIFLLIVAVYTIMFICDWPGLVRGSCMLTSMLLFRSSIPLIRINQPGKVLMYQWIGFGIQIYVLFCARLVMCTLQVFALMVKNVSEMWNFKFALRFKLLAKENRGELFHLELNHSIAKLWSHHRLIVMLIEEYGIVFCMGIMCYIIPQICVFAVALASLILSDDAHERQAFYGRGETHIKIYSDNAPVILIPYYHSILEETFMVVFIFLQIVLDFIFTTDTLVAATDAFMTGAEFVRRAGMMTAQKSHERRLILSLHWSFSPTRLHALTANRFFTLDRHSLFKLFSFVILVFTIIIRTHNPSPLFRVAFPPKGSCSGTLNQELINGICTIRGDLITNPIPPPPPADYYFFMDDCKDIESKHQDKVQKFEYYSGKDHSGVVQVADHPPFEICRVKIPNGTRLPTVLEDIGRYFQDHGNSRLQETLQIYFNQTVNISQIDYLKITASTLRNHSDSTGGGYCGPDNHGQQGKLCEWVEFYRDCVVACYSQLLGKALLIPKMWRKVGFNSYELYSDYSKSDCGINPFGFQFKGDPRSYEISAYDCFGNLVRVEDFDQCSNIPWKEPRSPFTPARGDPKRLQRSYTSDWLHSQTKTTNLTLATCDKCYDYKLAKERCFETSLVQDHCSYSMYWGTRAATKGYYLADQCFQWHIDTPKSTGFCKWDYVEGGVLAGHVISEADYNVANNSQWNKVWNLTITLPPCKQPGFTTGSLRPIYENLYFKHVCISGNVPGAGSCKSPSYFYAYRPYEFEDGCRNLRQIQMDYESTLGNHAICDFLNMTMYVPESVHFDLTVQGRLKTYTTFRGCHGGLLMPTKAGRSYNCISPDIGGVCEVNADEGFLLFGECNDPDVKASKSVVLGSRNHIYGQPIPIQFGLCSALLDYGDPVFRNERRKLLTSDLVFALMNETLWHINETYMWNDSMPCGVACSVYGHRGVPPLPDKPAYCDRLETHFCGQRSVALHYKHDNYNSTRLDKFLCNWEAYLRDCVQPVTSRIYGGTVYLPWIIIRDNFTMVPNQRKSDPLLNPFVQIFESGCDIRRLPDVDGNFTNTTLIDEYWKDQCGWLMLPEFVDRDRKSLAIMPPILPIPREAYADDGQSMVVKVLHCFESEYAIYRCLHPDIAPLCRDNLTNWQNTDGSIDTCYRFNSSCYKDMSKQPNGTTLTPFYPEGFCSGFCPTRDTIYQGAIGKNQMRNWRRIEMRTFPVPPCVDPGHSDVRYKFLFSTLPTIRPIEMRLFFEFHCSDRTKNGVIRDYTGSNSGSFHWPLFLGNTTSAYKFVPLQSLRTHLTATYGPNCDYGGRHNEGNIYPQYAVFNNNTTSLRVNQSEFLGCHGKPLVWFTELYRQNTTGMNSIGINDPYVDYPIFCTGRLLAGWCEQK